MPRLVHPLATLPPVMGEAYEAVRFEVRIALVAWLCRHPDSQVGEIADALGGHRAVLRRHLTGLEAVGVVIAAWPAGDRERSRVTYSVDIARWIELLDRIKSYPIDGEVSDSQP